MNKRFQEILSLAQTGHTEKALAKCEQIIRKKPREVNYMLLAASLHAQTQNYAEIVSYCNRAAKIDPKNFSALYNLSIAYLELQDYENAAIACKKALLLDPANAKVHSNLALAQWKLGQLDTAINSCQTALKYDKNLASAHNNLGLVYKSQKNSLLAINHFKQAMQLDPSLAEAHYNCGITVLETDATEGRKYIENALRIKPDYPEANNSKGMMLLDDGNTALAIKYFSKAIEKNKNYTEAYCNLGNALMAERQPKSAESMFRKAIELDPTYASAHNNLANALLDQDEYRQYFSEAKKHYYIAIELAPEVLDTYKNLAVCYQGEGLPEEALKYFEIYNDKVPGDDVVVAGMASVLERMGNYDKATDLLKPFINTGRISADIALAFARLAKHNNVEQCARSILADLEDKSINKKQQIEKYFELGKLAELAKEPDSTFMNYKMANDLEEETFDLEHSKKMFSDISGYFTAGKINQLNKATNNSRLPIFIVGMPRSGTSLAEQVLASHPEVYGAGELDDIHEIVRTISSELLPKNSYPFCLDNMTTEYATALSSKHLKSLQAKSPEAKHIVDKMPHNFLGLGIINILFPNAKIIHCKRSSIDTCLSIYFQHFNKHHAYSNSLKMLGAYYNLYADLMEHWKSALSVELIELQYEDVIANPEIEMKDLLRRCDIEWNPACLKFYENKRTVMTPSYDQVRRPIYKDSVAKWKKYEKHLDELITSLGNRAN